MYSLLLEQLLLQNGASHYDTQNINTIHYSYNTCVLNFFLVRMRWNMLVMEQLFWRNLEEVEFGTYW